MTGSQPGAIVKVLVIEDDVKIAMAVKRGLTAEGFTVEIAGDGDEGLWLATEGTFDAIVLDVLLPRRNGYLVCRALREAGDWTPILMLTAKAGELDETEALDTGADDFLAKPFSFAVLVARLRALVRRVDTRDAAAFHVGDLHVDPTRRQVSRGGEPLTLTSKEFDVLAFLLRRAGQVWSKSDVLAGVWSSDFEGDPNIVEVYVARLRRKLDRPGRASTIETVRGAGYRIVDDDR